MTRFHACERFDRCCEVKVSGRATHTFDGHHVVYVNPVTMGAAEWCSYVHDTEDRLRKGESVHHLVSRFAFYIVLHFLTARPTAGRFVTTFALT